MWEASVIRQRIRTPDFKYEIGYHVADRNRNLIITDRFYTTAKKYRYVCNSCGYTRGEIFEYNITNGGAGCPVCTNRIVVEGINDIPTTAPWMVCEYYEKNKPITRKEISERFNLCKTTTRNYLLNGEELGWCTLEAIELRSNNTSGIKGVYWHKRDRRWIAYIGINKKQKRLGHYINKEDAINARKEAEKSYGDE